jgi:hypothetical protein
MNPTWFLVRQHNGRESPALYFDFLPADLTRKLPRDERPVIIYGLRLDRLPEGERLAAMPLADLYALYQRLKARNKLPPQNFVDPPAKKDAARALIGHRERRKPRPGHNLPGEPFPAPDGLRPRPEAPAFIAAPK